MPDALNSIISVVKTVGDRIYFYMCTVYEA